MRFVFDGQYREFMGHVFFNGQPVTVTDTATIEAMQKEPTLRRVPDEKEIEVAAPAQAVLEQPKRETLRLRRRA